LCEKNIEESERAGGRERRKVIIIIAHKDKGRLMEIIAGKMAQ
jgi:hypothetical protein